MLRLKRARTRPVRGPPGSEEWKVLIPEPSTGAYRSSTDSSCVAPNAASVYRRLCDPPVARMDGDLDMWEPPEPVSLGESIGRQLDAQGYYHHSLDFYKTSQRLVKSESEDSGVEMASGETSPPTPPGSQRSFLLEEPESAQAPSLTCLTDCPSRGMGDPPEDRMAAQGKGRKPGRSPQRVNTKLEQAMQRSKRQRAAGRPARRLPSLALARRHGGSLPSLSVDMPRMRTLQGVEASSTGELGPSGRHRRDTCRTDGAGPAPLAEMMLQEWEEDNLVEVEAQNPLVLPGQGLRYLEHICQMLEKMAELQQRNLSLQREKLEMEAKLCGRDPAQAKLAVQVCGTGAPQGTSQLDRHPPFRTHFTEPPQVGLRKSFKERSLSASDVNLWDFAAIQGNEPRPSGSVPAHFVSSPDLKDSTDGCVPPHPQRHKNEPSQWEWVKELIGKIARKAVGPGEPPTSLYRDPVGSSTHYRGGLKQENRRPPSRKAFLPTIVKKKRVHNPPVH